MLSVVLPIRCTSENEWLLDRLAANLTVLGRYEAVECVVVDSASEGARVDRVRRLCEDHPRARFVADPDPRRPFSPGSARNVGAQNAAGEFLLFYDVDLCSCDTVVPTMLRWIDDDRGACDFLVVPCLYLTEDGSQLLGTPSVPVDLAPFRESLLAGENGLVSHLAPSTSTVVVSRAHFLRIGGNRREYFGHGCEDFDLLHRLASYDPIGKRDPDYYSHVKGPFPGNYRGFRAYFARYGLPRLFEGLYTAHLWHPRPLLRPYFRRRAANEWALPGLMRRHDEGRAAPEPLEDPAAAASSLPPLPRPWSGEPGEALPPIGDVIRASMSTHGWDPDRFPGLFRWKEGVERPPGTMASKLRKLLRRPKDFLADSRFGALRSLGRWLREQGRGPDDTSP